MKRKLTIGLTILGLVALGPIVYELFRLPHWAVLAWAILATVLIPVVALGGWALGRYEAQALIRGIDAGIDRVSGAAIKLRTRDTKSPVQVAVLPQFQQPAVVRKQLPDGQSEVVDL